MLYATNEQTIIAQCTPQGSGAIALIRISGTNAIEISSCFAKLHPNKKLTSVASHTIHYGWVVDENNRHIDQVLFLVMKSPQTFTGQDTVEITCHNNSFIIETIIQQALNNGARLAQEGEFSKRAVLNNKIDLTQAEAINELIHANTQTALKQSLAQVEGSLSQWINIIEKNLVKALAFSEASFEFIDEEEITFDQEISTIIDNTRTTIKRLKNVFNQQQQIRQGIRIAIIGSVNAGKSSLFNALLDKERAIVTKIAGTTRDVIESGLYKNGNYWTLIDTAGLRTTQDKIEQEGIRRSFEQAKQADIILLVFDGSRILSNEEKKVYDNLQTQFNKKNIIVINKSDLPSVKFPQGFKYENFITVSSKTKNNINIVEAAIQKKIDQLFNEIEAPFLLNRRQFLLLLSLDEKLKELKNMLLQPDLAYELISTHLNDALSHLSELTGKTISEKGMDAVFREFCVGK